MTCLKVDFEARVLLATAIIDILDWNWHPFQCRFLRYSAISPKANFITTKFAKSLQLLLQNVDPPITEMNIRTSINVTRTEALQALLALVDDITDLVNSQRGYQEKLSYSLTHNAGRTCLPRTVEDWIFVGRPNIPEITVCRSDTVNALGGIPKKFAVMVHDGRTSCGCRDTS